MNGYGTLAEMLRSSGYAEERFSRDPVRQEFDPAAFFEQVKAHIIEEVQKANAELHKRGLASIERVLVPCYLGRLCLTFGTALMCCVDFEVSKGRTTFVIVGPPNRREILRKEYPFSRGPAKLEVASTQSARNHTISYGPAAVASAIVSQILETGIRLTQKRAQPIDPAPVTLDEPHFAEFWISLASLLRSYTALHGASDNRQAEIETAGATIIARQAEKWLILKRHHAIVTWTRENGMSGAFEFTEHGTLRGDAGDEPMDLVVEQWARDLMHREPLVQIGN